MASAGQKIIIGLTGNIASGKSVVRKMLEHLGAYGIDADALAHRAIAKDAPGYKPVVEQFGKMILDSGKQIDRKKLSEIVFSDPQALKKLELIIHPLVRKAVKYLISKAEQEVIVVEAIKLLESPLKYDVHSIWVTKSSEKKQIARLSQKRGMSEEEARLRLANQSSQEAKEDEADVVIENDGSFDDTWKQVSAAFRKLAPHAISQDSAPKEIKGRKTAQLFDLAQEELEASRGKPNQAKEIAAFINEYSGNKKFLTRGDVMAAFGEKAFMLLHAGDILVGLAGWQVENLVTCVDGIVLAEGLDLPNAIKTLVEQIEKDSMQLQAEAALVITEPEIASEKTWNGLGYKPRTTESLKVSAWQEAAMQSLRPGKVLLFKQLRIDRVLRPI